MYTYEIFSDQKICVFTGRGNITFNQISETSKMMLSDSNWQTGWNILYDLRNSNFSELNYKTSKDSAKIDQKYYNQIKGGKVAVVADKDVTYGLFRMYFTIADNRPQDAQIFRNIEDAIIFLDLNLSFIKQLGHSV